MAVFNGNREFSSKKQKSMPYIACPQNVRQALNIDKAYKIGTFKVEPKKKQALYDRCYIFEDINYINKNKGEQKSFLLDLMLWLNSMNVAFKISLVNQYQRMDEFLASIRSEKNGELYPDIRDGIRAWQDEKLEEMNPSVTTLRYLVITSHADNEASAKIYLNALETTIMDAFAGWGSRIERITGEERLCVLQKIALPERTDEKEYISTLDEKGKRDWKNDILPRSIKQYRNFMIMGDAYVTVLYASKYRKTIDSDTFIHNLSNVSYPSVLTMDFAPVDAEVVNDKLVAAQMNTDREITEELEQRQKAGILALTPSYPRQKKKQEIINYIDLVDDNDEKGFFMNLLIILTADTEEKLGERVEEMQAIARKEGCVLETCDFRQLKAWNTALPVGGRQVDYMRFFLTSSLVAFQPYHAQDVLESGGQMFGINRTTKRFILANRTLLKNPHGLIIGPSGTGKSMFIKLTELSQSLIATDDDITVIDPQNEFEDVVKSYGGAYFDLTPKSGIYLNGFEVSQEAFKSEGKARMEFIAKQTEYAKTLCAAAMKNIIVTQEHDSVISRCTERMYKKVFEQKRLKKQPTLIWLREEIKQELERTDNAHDEGIIRPIYNSLEEYTEGSCDMLAHPSNIRLKNNRLVGFGMVNVPDNNWEAIMVTILHYLSIRMEYNKALQKATRLIVDEAQYVSKKQGSADQLNNAVITFRKFGGIVTMAMQNVTAALSNQKMVELFQNCAYKCFLDTGGVDARELAAIQELSEKEFRALSEGKVGQGVMVWDKKVILFDAKISNENPLYEKYSTNFHEKAKNKSQEKEENKKEDLEEILPEELTDKKDRHSKEIQYRKVLQIAELTAIDVEDTMQLLGVTKEESEKILNEMEQKNLLIRKNGKYRVISDENQ